MSILSKGITFATGDQVTATKLNNLVDSATFASGAVDDVSVGLSGGALYVKDLGVTTARIAANAVTPAKLSTGGPYWNTSGYVGVGTTSPTFRFVSADSSFDGMWGGSSSTYSFLGLGGYYDAAAGSAQIGYERSTGSLTFGVGTRDTPTERFRVDVTGNVGIGTTTPASKLEVNGSFSATSASIGGTAIYPLTRPSAQAPNNVNSVDFYSIPSWVKRITILLDGISTNGSADLIIQIGSSGGFETSGYTSVAYDNGGSVTDASSFIITRATTSSSNSYGIITICNAYDNSWVSSGQVSYGSILTSSNGVKALSSTLDRLRLITNGGIDKFDAGAVNIMYE